MLTACWQQVGAISGQHFSSRGFVHDDSLRLRHPRKFRASLACSDLGISDLALQRLISFNCAGGDVRWAIIALALRSFAVLWVFGQRQFVLLVRNVAGRVWAGACFAADITDADSMVAAGS